jgi:hypothetical protein
VIQVAIIRPGPIQGDMVHPSSAPAEREEEVSFPLRRAGLEQVLAKTLGVPLFQEQAMQIAIVGAGFTPEEADRLRRALATFKKARQCQRFPHSASCAACARTAMTRISPSAAFPRSRASAATASPKATRPVSRCWSMPRPG